MTASPVLERGASLTFLEGGLTVIVVGLAFCWPRLGSAHFKHIEGFLGRLARKQGLAVLTVGITAVLLRLLILPFSPIPQPFVQDDFSFLLAANTFASGRLTNPTPVMWSHFESFHIIMKPTYMSMYFPANGLVMAAGKVLFGHPWYGILCVMGLMCAALSWMLQAWLPPTWAFLGGMLAVLRLGLFSYWINTYTGAGCISALGGALVLGAIPRFVRTPKFRYGLLASVGVILLANSREYEGALLCLPVVIALVWWLLLKKNRPPMRALVRAIAIPLMLMIAAGIWMGYYNYRVFGSPLTPPYKINRATYAITPYYVWQQPRPEPVYRHKVMAEYYRDIEPRSYRKLHSLVSFLSVTIFKAAAASFFFSGIALLPPLIMLRRALADRRIRFLLICGLVLAAGMLIEIFFIPHYVAPFTAVFYAIGLQCMRHLRAFRLERQPVGTALVRLTVFSCIALGVMRLYAEPLHFRVAQLPSTDWDLEWYGPGNFGTARAHIEDELEHEPGKQLVLVRYAPNHSPEDEWVYNAPDIDNSKVIWAREMDDADNLELIRYYKDHKVWLVQPDLQPAGLSPYPVPMDIHSASTEKSENKAH